MFWAAFYILLIFIAFVAVVVGQQQKPAAAAHISLCWQATLIKNCVCVCAGLAMFVAASVVVVLLFRLLFLARSKIISLRALA